MSKMMWVYTGIGAFWLAAAAALFFGWLPRPEGGVYQSTPVAGLALLLFAWNLVRIWLISQKRGTSAAP
jgi:hypothetical protein